MAACAAGASSASSSAPEEKPAIDMSWSTFGVPNPSPLARHLFVRWPTHIVEAALRDPIEIDRFFQPFCVMDQTVCICNDMSEPGRAPSPPRTREPTRSATPAVAHKAESQRHAFSSTASQTQEFKARKLVEAILQQQVEPVAATAQREQLERALERHESGELDKAAFLAEVRKLSDRDALRRAIVTLADASDDVRLRSTCGIKPIIATVGAESLAMTRASRRRSKTSREMLRVPPNNAADDSGGSSSGDSEQCVIDLRQIPL
jgi:hypothetical protein